MKEITVKTQSEFDALPDKFTEFTRIYLEGRITINKAWGNSYQCDRFGKEVKPC